MVWAARSKIERPLFHFVLMLVQDRTVAEELVQEAFARAWASKNTPSDESGFRRWLYRVAGNLARDWQRRRMVESKLRFWATPPSDPENEVVRRDGDRELLMALRELRLRERQAIYLHYYEDLSFFEIGRILGMKETGARVMVHRALQKLRGELKPAAASGEVLT